MRYKFRNVILRGFLKKLHYRGIIFVHIYLVIKVPMFIVKQKRVSNSYHICNKELIKIRFIRIKVLLVIYAFLVYILPDIITDISSVTDLLGSWKTRVCTRFIVLDT